MIQCINFATCTTLATVQTSYQYYWQIPILIGPAGDVDSKHMRITQDAAAQKAARSKRPNTLGLSPISYQWNGKTPHKWDMNQHISTYTQQQFKPLRRICPHNLIGKHCY